MTRQWPRLRRPVAPVLRVLRLVGQPPAVRADGMRATPGTHSAQARAERGPDDASPVLADSQVAVLVVQLGWALDDAAHDLPAGRMTPQRREELATGLEALATVLRTCTPDGARPLAEEYPTEGTPDQPGHPLSLTIPATEPGGRDG